MSLPTSEPIPSETQSGRSGIRRRRYRRRVAPQTAEEKAAWLQNADRQITPSFDFFLSCLLCSLILAIALLLRSDALLILGVLLAPFLGPVLGLSLTAVSGSGSTLVKSGLSLIAAALFVFGFGALAGAMVPFLPLPAPPIFTGWAEIRWDNLVLLAVGASLAVITLVRSPRQRPLAASIAIAYSLFPGLTAAGYNLVAYSDPIWLVGISTIGVYLAWTVFVAILIFIFLGFAPRSLLGFLLTALTLGILVAVGMTGTAAKGINPAVQPTQAPLVIPPAASTTPTPTLTATLTPTRSPVPSATLTPTITFAPTGTATQTITPVPTPIYARVEAPTGGGALLRDEPDGKIISSLLNGNMIEVISDPVRGTTGIIWVKVRTETGLEGWIVQGLLITATPAAGW